MSAIVLAAILFAQQGSWTGFGGNESCATWTSNPANEDVAKFWIWGFWSGRNSGLALNVGANTDAQGILEEVRLECRARPSLSIATATFRVYERMRADGT